jgi:prepilin-type N-terminal cleavage/methylation domain-containing protein
MPKKSSTKPHLAFSLIELSVVILVIGILVIGITKGNRIITQAKLKSAQSLTTSSPVVSTSGLVLWLESVDENNFLAAQTSDGANLTQWKDRNPQMTTKNNTSRGTSDSNITYKAKGINGLPSIYFNGTSGASSFLSGSAIITPNNHVTFFIVSKSDDNIAAVWRSAFQNGTQGSNGFSYQKNSAVGAGKRSFTLSTVIDNLGSIISVIPEVASATYNGTNATLFINGTQDTLTPGTGTMKAPTGGLSIGNISTGTTAWSGLISELIVFNRVLTTTERRAIEQYLGTKWGVRVI